MYKGLTVCMMTNNVSRMPNYMDDKKDPNQNRYESKIENDVYLYFSH